MDLSLVTGLVVVAFVGLIAFLMSLLRFKRRKNHTEVIFTDILEGRNSIDEMVEFDTTDPEQGPEDKPAAFDKKGEAKVDPVPPPQNEEDDGDNINSIYT